MRKIFTLLLATFLIVTTSIGQQNHVFDEVNKAKSQNQLSEVIDFDIKATKGFSFDQKNTVSEVPFEFDQEKLSKVITSQANYIHLTIPGLNGRDVDMELIKVNLFAPNFKVTVDMEGIKEEMDEDFSNSIFYRGIANGEENSLVALSLFEGKMVGFINSSSAGNIGIRQNADGIQVLQNLNSLSHQELSCSTKDDGQGYASEMLEAPKTSEKNAGDYVSVFVEVENDLTDQLGGVSQAITYMTDLFNETAAIYAGDGVDIRLSELEINTTAEYGRRRGKNFVKPSGASQYLDLFKTAKSSSFNGDIAHLAVFNNIGGIAAGFSGICNADRRESMCISGFVNDYFFNLQIFAHEMGHLLGSRHTHACVWNGNNTAIDGCSGSTEGTCALPPNPGENQGTIMSYCYNSIGLDFNEGFHPQPAAVIQNTILNASCLMSGGNSGPTCFDGVQNGDETGVDCGGSCNACPPDPTCTDGIQNGNETGVDCGGSCDACPPVSCDTPSSLLVRNMRNKKGTGTATLDWSDVSGATSYDVRIRTAGSSSWTNLSASSSNINVTGFATGSYEWEVRANCSSGSSDYTGCTFTYVNRGSNVNCGTSSLGSDPFLIGVADITLSPNPVSDNLLIQISDPQSDNYDVVIYNALGQEVLLSKMTKDQPWMEVDVANFQSGIFIVSVNDGVSKMVSKFLVQ